MQDKKRAVFLDRDGTINVLKGYLCSYKNFELIPGVAEAIKKLNGSEYLTIVATNQSGIARGYLSIDELSKIHKKMKRELAEKGAYIDDLFFCPHYPTKGIEGEIPKFKIACDCRKPGIGMLRQAAEKYNINLAASWYIGDTTTDIQTGINAGMHTILVGTGEAGLDGKYDVIADYNASDLYEAVRIILKEEMPWISNQRLESI